MTSAVLLCRTLTELHSSTKQVWIELRSTAATPWAIMFSNIAGAFRLHDSHLQLHRRPYCRYLCSCAGAKSGVIAYILVGLRPFTPVPVHFARLLG